MDKHNMNLVKIKVERDSLQATLMQTNANYWKLKAKKEMRSPTSIRYLRWKRSYHHSSMNL
jgi:hypothetical protein